MVIDNLTKICNTNLKDKMAPRSLNSLPYMLAGMAAKDLYRSGRKYLTAPYSKKRRTATAKRKTAVPRMLTAYKRHQETINGSSRKIHALYDELVSAIPQGSDLNERERQQIFVRSVNVNHYCLAQDTVDTPVLGFVICRMVVAQLRYQDDDYTPGGTDASRDLFTGMVADATTDFGVHSNGLNSLTLPINHRKWRVFMDKKYKMSPRNATSESSGVYNNALVIEENVPINQKIYFNGTGSSSCSNPIVLLYWYENPTWASLGASTTNPVYDRTVCNITFSDIL